MSVYEEMVGKRYGRWTAVSRDISRAAHLICLCVCGKKASVYTSSLRLGKSLSCGCHRVEVQRALHTKHGHADLRNGNVTRAYYCWTNMKTRCYNKRSQDYHNYGGRGITVCPRWKHSFAAFLEDMGEPPTGKTLDRERVDEDYGPDNCRWATAEEQSRNRRDTLRGVLNGEEISLIDAVEKHGAVVYRTAVGRVKAGWSFVNAVTLPLQRQAKACAPKIIRRTRKLQKMNTESQRV